MNASQRLLAFLHWYLTMYESIVNCLSSVPSPLSIPGRRKGTKAAIRQGDGQRLLWKWFPSHQVWEQKGYTIPRQRWSELANGEQSCSVCEWKWWRGRWWQYKLEWSVHKCQRWIGRIDRDWTEEWRGEWNKSIGAISSATPCQVYSGTCG